MRGPAVWVYRYTENGVRKKVQIGSVEQAPTLAEATKASEGMRLMANPAGPAARSVTFGAVIQQYLREELPDRKSTRTFYRPWINNYIEPQWRDYTLGELARMPFAVEQWLNKLALAPKSKANIRSLMRIMVNCAMRWGLLEVQENPIGLVRVRNCTKRKRQPQVMYCDRRTGPGAVQNHADGRDLPGAARE